MFDQLEAIEQNLKVWRGVILILTLIMLFISLASEDKLSILTLIICFMALLLFQLRNLPTTTYQLFILLLSGYTIFILGTFLQGFYDKNDINTAYIVKNAYNILTNTLFIIILWRHYQKDAFINQIQGQVENY